MFKMLKNQKGMTLVELLAVMVIVGIIAAISIPAIGGLLENTRKDAFVSSAVTLQDAARLYYSTYENEDGLTITYSNEQWKVGETVVNDFVGYLENFTDPTNNKQNFTSAEVTITKNKTTGQTTYKTTLTGAKYSLPTGDDAKDATQYTRENVTATPASAPKPQSDK